MSATEPESTRTVRFAGAVAAFIIFAGALTALLVALEAVGTEEQTVLFIGKAFTYTGFGALVIGWKWPHAVLRPFKRFVPNASGATNLAGAAPINESPSNPAQGRLGKLLSSSLQRGLFALACLGLVPWLLMRLVRELWGSSGAADYIRNVFVEPISPWFESGWWWYAKLEWYDWPVLPSLVGICLAFAWPYTGERIMAWVWGAK